MAYQEQLDLLTAGRGTYNITKDVQKVVAASNVITGLCHVFVKHTSASLILCENADPTVRSDLERFMINLVPDGSPLFRHIDEGDDDMPAHIRSILTNMDLTLPVNHRMLKLGTWQGIYLYEQRSRAHQRQVVVTVTC